MSEFIGFSEEALARAKGRMEAVDALPPDLRACVHEFGWTIVHQFLLVGVTKPKHIRHLIERVREGSREVGNRQQTQTVQDEILRRSARFVRKAGYLVVPKEPTTDMVGASIDALDVAGISHTNVPRTRKHAIRLLHAMVVGDNFCLQEGGE